MHLGIVFAFCEHEIEQNILLGTLCSVCGVVCENAHHKNDGSVVIHFHPVDWQMDTFSVFLCN